MAKNLAKAGHSLVVYDVNKEVTEKFKSETPKCEAAASVADVGQNCSTVITMLPSSPHVRDVYLGNDPKRGSLFQSVKRNTLLIDSSTVDPGTSRYLYSEAVKLNKGIRLVDAPVSGGVGGAEAGTLTFMVGGSLELFTAAIPFLSLMGKNIVHCGDAGAGQAAKVCNNLVLAISMIGVSEGLNLGVKLGLDPKILSGIFNSSSARCWSSETYNPCPGVMPNVPSSRGYTGGFAVDLMKKDLSLAQVAAKSVDTSTPLGELAHLIYEALSQRGHGSKDFSYIYEFLSKEKRKQIAEDEGQGE